MHYNKLPNEIIDMIMLNTDFQTVLQFNNYYYIKNLYNKYDNIHQSLFYAWCTRNNMNENIMNKINLMPVIK
jgi:metal-dependent HD superfamily phosphatase/phosphodiesterase